MTNRYIEELENKLHGYHTRLKELHFGAPSVSVHKIIDDFKSDRVIVILCHYSYLLHYQDALQHPHIVVFAGTSPKWHLRLVQGPATACYTLEGGCRKMP